ncbi:Cbb3-type cytochrome c oxidase subunit [Shewanella sp. NFH-SH190041]|uniref:cytochrome-c oxidase, cbb3-type subunit III n=1 Tax=Shewanella sp. NFH-SH190041 TaxID=2950245 RepID=UPI0021C2CD72|nr:cytochrome-c oxidase, cbb3-type subunit III [Shewanella sp. NFH-SH190041]BDM64124.1 Cbb3-type cytochrome c oxidase subunit [Shewanella sp. NFH-SH190041]
MSSFWSIWITVLTIAVILGCIYLLWACNKNNTDVSEGESMGHSFDGIEELNNPLPKWWSYMFYITIVFGVVYLLLYPGLGNFKGLMSWTSSHQGITSLEQSKQAVADAANNHVRVQYDREMAQAEKQYGPIFKAFADTPLEQLVHNEEALKVGGRLFLQNCAQCHGSDARGSTGFPNLADNAWLYGGDLATIKTTLLNGRNGMMMPKGGLPIDDAEIPGLTEYVVKLSGRKHDEALAAQGQASFMKGCFACHGMDGTGNKLMGAPNLTDTAWLYGGSRGAIAESIQQGRTGMMPAWKDILGEDKVHVITAYVYSLSQEKSNK